MRHGSRQAPRLPEVALAICFAAGGSCGVREANVGGGAAVLGADPGLSERGGGSEASQQVIGWDGLGGGVRICHLPLVV